MRSGRTWGPPPFMVSCRSDRGRSRARNEDHVLVDHAASVVLLADGMGGHHAGHVASALAVQKAYSYLLERLHSDLSDREIERLLVDAARVSHDAVLTHARDIDRRGDMGTTLLSLILRGGKAFIGHTGDSRAYIMRERLCRITEDHAVRDPFLEWLLRADDAHPAAGSRRLTRAVGMNDFQPPDILSVDIGMGDLLLLCSDGLTEMLSDDELDRWLHAYRSDPEGLAEILVQEANKKGGYDNISVVLVRQREPGQALPCSPSPA